MSLPLWVFVPLLTAKQPPIITTPPPPCLPCPLPTKISLEPKTQIKEKKKKTTRSLPHPTHLNPKDKNQSMPHCKTNTKPTQIGETTKPRSAKPFDPQCHQINIATNAANITPHLAHHQWSWVTHHRRHWQPTNLHQETHKFLSIQNPHRSPCRDHEPNPTPVQALNKKERCEIRETVRIVWGTSFERERESMRNAESERKKSKKE